MNKLQFFGNKVTRYCIMCSVASLCTIGFPACSDDYDDSDIKKEIQDVKDRVAKLEEWQKTVNADITSLQGLVEALQSKNFITDVTPVTENEVEVGYTISFQTGKSITIKHGENGKDGKDGATPVIGVAKDGDVYYWTIKTGEAEAEFLTDAEGNKMPVTGPKGEAGADAVAPQLRINSESNEWELSTDGGESWTATGVKATGDKGDKGEQGDAIFAKDGVDIDSDPDNVIFTLADGTTLTVPKAATVWVGFDGYNQFTVAQNSNVLDIILPATLQETDYVAMVAEVRSASGTGMDILTKGVSPWVLTLTEPTFAEGVCQNDAKVKVGATAIEDGEKALLKVTLITGKGEEISASRPIIFYNGAVVNPSLAGGLEAALNGLDPAEVASLKVIGSLSADDLKYLKSNFKGTLEEIDLSDADITEISDWQFKDFLSLKKVTMPEGLQKIGYQAFYNCPIENVIIPDNVTEIGTDAFRINKPNPAKMESVVIGAGVKTIPDNCFMGQKNLKTVTIPAGVEKISKNAFSENSSLTTIVLPESLKEIGTDAFRGCGFTQITIPDNVTTIGERAFQSCASLTDVTLSKSLKTLGGNAFNKCGIIATIDLPETIVTFGVGAFDWGKATTIICRAKSVPNNKASQTVWDNHFATVTDKDAVTVKVPAESVKTYKSKWGKYFSNIEAIE